MAGESTPRCFDIIISEDNHFFFWPRLIIRIPIFRVCAYCFLKNGRLIIDDYGNEHYLNDNFLKVLHNLCKKGTPAAWNTRFNIKHRLSQDSVFLPLITREGVYVFAENETELIFEKK